jgi:hypothetical protein
VLQAVKEYCQRSGLRVPAALIDADTTGLLASVRDLTVLHADAQRADTLDAALAAMAAGFFERPRNLLPVGVIDEGSIACIVCHQGSETTRDPVVRWFLSDVDPRFQGALLDVDAYEYLESLDYEMAARLDGLRRILDWIGPAYQEAYLAKDKRPRDFVIRPVRIACQNVIVGLAAFAQDSTFDGLSVVAWQTCEVPHVATHEGNRALAALTLCDAFRNGGTMEIRFDRDARLTSNGRRIVYHGHPEKAVPASLRRYGRTVGVYLGAEDPAAITPAEARELFLAVTPMPAELRTRVDDAVATRGISPERICFSLLSQIWREPELDFILATSGRAASILEGGAPWTDRASRQAESEVCRAAVMAGMLFRRLNSTDAAGDASSAVRVVEDRSTGVTWDVDEVSGAVTFRGLDATASVPWTHGIGGVDEVTVFPRTALTSDLARALAADGSPGLKAVLVPADVPSPPDPDGVVILRCPDRLADIDKDIERRLLTSRISRG